MKKNFSIFFVASPLQALVAQCIAENFEINRELILVFYKKDLEKIVSKDIWGKHVYMPWPRHDPETGIFGVHKRLVNNLSLINHLVTDCQSLFFYSAVYDTEAINYFVSFFKKKLGSSNFSARIIPDGIISTRRYPLTEIKKFLKKTRNFRQFFNKNLVYSHFSGDRIGSDAEFIDIIYVLNGMPHQYDKKKVVTLPPIIRKNSSATNNTLVKRALIIGQPLKGFKLMNNDDIFLTSNLILDWINKKQITEVFYKKHPKDKLNTLFKKKYHQLPDNLSIEIHLSKNHYDYIIGVNSSVLLLAKQICSTHSVVVSFGINKINFKNSIEEFQVKNLFENFKIEMQNV